MRKILTTLTLASLAFGVPAAASAAPADPSAEAPVAAAPAAVPAAPTSTALETFRESEQKVNALADGGADTKTLESAVDALLDYEWLSTAALGGSKKYAKRCGDRCTEFNDLLSKLIRRNYLKRISARDEGEVVIVDQQIKVRKGREVAKVNTIVVFNGPREEGQPTTVDVSYVMHAVNGHWQVRDIRTDGLSLAKVWQHDFVELHKEGGIDLVISSLESKLVELDSLAQK